MHFILEQPAAGFLTPASLRLGSLPAPPRVRAAARSQNLYLVPAPSCYRRPPPPHIYSGFSFVKEVVPLVQGSGHGWLTPSGVSWPLYLLHARAFTHEASTFRWVPHAYPSRGHHVPQQRAWMLTAGASPLPRTAATVGCWPLCWLLLCVGLAGPQCPDVWSTLLLEVSVRVFGDEINV